MITTLRVDPIRLFKIIPNKMLEKEYNICTYTKGFYDLGEYERIRLDMACDHPLPHEYDPEDINDYQRHLNEFHQKEIWFINSLKEQRMMQLRYLLGKEVFYLNDHYMQFRETTKENDDAIYIQTTPEDWEIEKKLKKYYYAYEEILIIQVLDKRQFMVEKLRNPELNNIFTFTIL